MNANTQWLKSTIAPQGRSKMPNDTLKKSYDTFENFSKGFTDFSKIEKNESISRVLGVFREKYELVKAKEVQTKTEPKPKPVKAEKPKPEPKPAKPKAEPKVKADKPKKEKDCDCDEKKKAKSAPKPKSASKPKTQEKAEAKAEAKKESVKKASVKTAKPKADKKPTASEKAVEKARDELRKVKAENREYEKRIMFDSDFLTTLLMQTQGYARNRKGLGALPSELSQELKKERALNTLYRQVMKRNVKAFKSLEVRLKKSNEVTPAMERKFMQLYSTLNGLKQSAVAKRKVTVKKKKKGFLARLFS